MDRIQWDMVLISAAVVVAALDFLKDVLPGRALFNRYIIANWLARNTGSTSAAFGQLVLLAAGGRSSSLLRLPINQMAAQINAAAEAALEFPSKYPELFIALCGKGDEDAELFLKMKDGFRKEYANSADLGSRQGDLMDVRARLAAKIQRRIDDLQIHGRTTWRLTLQMGALAMGLMLVPFFDRREDPIIFGTVLAAGFLAPILHDLVKSVTQRSASM